MKEPLVVYNAAVGACIQHKFLCTPYYKRHRVVSQTFVAGVVMRGGQHGSCDWSQRFLVILFLLHGYVFGCSLASCSPQSCFRAFPGTKFACLVIALNSFSRFGLLFPLLLRLFGRFLICDEGINIRRGGGWVRSLFP